MIWESCYWKDPLLKAATWLRSVKLGETTRDSTHVRIEKEIFLGFYSIRKLLDTYKISDATKVTKLELTWFENKKAVTYINWHNLDKLYDLSTPHSENRDLRFLCNQFVHSFIFVVSGNGRIDGVFVASDNVRNRKVYFVSLDQIIQMFRLVGRDYPASGSWKRDPDTGELSGSAW